MMGRALASVAASKLAPRLVHRRQIRRAARGEAELTLLPLLCAHDRISIDVGANRGLYTERLLPLSAGVIAFEPLPQMQQVLRRMYRNRIGLETVALSDDTGEVRLRLPDSNSSWATIAPSNKLALADQKRVTSVLVPVRTLDSYAFGAVGLIKIDVEGHEEAVLRGAKKTLCQEQPNLIIEIEERHNPGAITRTAEWLRELGYVALFLDEGRLRPLSEFDLHRDQHPSNVGVTGRLGRYINNFIFVQEKSALKVATSLFA